MLAELVAVIGGEDRQHAPGLRTFLDRFDDSALRASYRATEGDLVVQDYEGRVVVKGTGISGGFSKGRIGMIAEGKGKAKLKGKGGYKVNGTPGKWSVPAAQVSW